MHLHHFSERAIHLQIMQTFNSYKCLQAMNFKYQPIIRKIVCKHVGNTVVSKNNQGLVHI